MRSPSHSYKGSSGSVSPPPPRPITPPRNPGYYTKAPESFNSGLQGSGQTNENSRFLYKTNCELCKWVSNQSYDQNMFPYFVNELEVHMKWKHGGDANATNANERPPVAAEQQEFIEATRPRIIPESTDDRNHSFCQGRFLPGPINWKNCAKFQPLEQNPILPRIDLSHIGLILHDNMIVRWAHSRANRKTSKLDRWSSENLKRDEDRKKFLLINGEMTEGENFVPITRTIDCTIAAYNYVVVMRYLHPQDMGPEAMFRVLLDKVLFSAMLISPDLIKQFFLSVVDENCGRAVRTEPPMSHQECLARWAELARTFELEGRVVVQGISQGGGGFEGRQGNVEDRNSHDRDMKQQLRHLTKKLDRLESKHGKRSAGKGGNPDGSPGPTGPKKQRKLPYCGQFNQPAGCSNEKVSDYACKASDGRIYLHSCNVKVGASFCGAHTHNKYGHK